MPFVQKILVIGQAVSLPELHQFLDVVGERYRLLLFHRASPVGCFVPLIATHKFLLIAKRTNPTPMMKVKSKTSGTQNHVCNDEEGLSQHANEATGPQQNGKINDVDVPFGEQARPISPHQFPTIINPERRMKSKQSIQWIIATANTFLSVIYRLNINSLLLSTLHAAFQDFTYRPPRRFLDFRPYRSHLVRLRYSSTIDRASHRDREPGTLSPRAARQQVPPSLRLFPCRHYRAYPQNARRITSARMILIEISFNFKRFQLLQAV